MSVLGDDVDESVDLAIQAAVDEYSRDRPLEIVEDETGNGTSYYALTLLASWENDWSYIAKIEYDADADPATTDPNPQWLDPVSDWREYRTSSTRYLFLPHHAPDSSQTLRIWYTTRHTLTEASGTVTDTIPAGDKRAVLDLAAAHVCQQLSTEAAQHMAPDLQSATKDFSAESDLLARAGKRWRESYERHIRGRPQEAAPAVVFGDLDPKTKQPGGIWLTHSGRR